jgi:hypothetical protein
MHMDLHGCSSGCACGMVFPNAFDMLDLTLTCSIQGLEVLGHLGQKNLDYHHVYRP